MEKQKRLIDAEVVRHKINAFAASVVYRGSAEMFTGKDTCNPHEYTRGYERGVLDAQKIVCGQATVDAAEVVHGQWIPYKISNSFTHSCSVCCCDVNGKTPYCPYCGANMCGGNENV